MLEKLEREREREREIERNKQYEPRMLMPFGINLINDWFRANKLCLNVKKTKYIIFSPSSNPNIGNHSLNIDNQNIDKIGNDMNTKSFKFLSLEIDECIAWKWHIDKICNKISRSIYAINKVKNILPPVLP